MLLMDTVTPVSYCITLFCGVVFLLLDLISEKGALYHFVSFIAVNIPSTVSAAHEGKSNNVIYAIT